MEDVELVLLVGHEPPLGELIGRREASIHPRPGSVARLNAVELHPGSALSWSGC